MSLPIGRANLGTYAFAQLLKALPRERITRAVGGLCELSLPGRLSRAAVGAYVRAYDVNMDEAEPLSGGGSYTSFDAFFTRRLKANARPIEAPVNQIISPADGRLDAAGTVRDDGIIEVKGKPYSAAELLCSDQVLDRYRGGPFAVVYLSPRDYHRVHMPAPGRVTELRSKEGELFPVNRISELHFPGFLSLNRRVAIQIERTHADGSKAPELTVVMVAAMIVGRITVTGIADRDVPYGVRTLDLELARGDELSVFHLGSTAVVFAEPTERSFDRPMGPIRLGEPLQRQEAP